jgi:hypothetical protein
MLKEYMSTHIGKDTYNACCNPIMYHKLQQLPKKLQRRILSFVVTIFLFGDIPDFIGYGTKGIFLNFTTYFGFICECGQSFNFLATWKEKNHHYITGGAVGAKGKNTCESILTC